MVTYTPGYSSLVYNIMLALHSDWKSVLTNIVATLILGTNSVTLGKKKTQFYSSINVTLHKHYTELSMVQVIDI